MKSKNIKDAIILGLLCSLSLVFISWTLLRDGKSPPPPNNVFHFFLCMRGATLSAMGAGFFGLIASYHCFSLPDPFGTARDSYKFRSEIHFLNWVFALLLGLAIVLYEFRLEADWFLIYETLR